jgi:benzoyl-CoA reductase/2-hydroxyglutaryl-CoA dehydratase subunit BcrC/BadD/HgdB
MTAKDKAKELVDRYNEHMEFDTNFKDETNKAKNRALICVDEMLSIYDAEGYDSEDYKIVYLEEVKQEIEKL